MTFVRRVSGLSLGAGALGFTALSFAWAGGGIQLSDFWVRSSIGQTPNSAAYLQITNTGDLADRLVAVNTSAARMAQLHQHANEYGVMKMRPVEGGITVPAGESVTLAPGGLHIMLMGVEEKLQEGQSIPVTLTFEHQGEIAVEMVVRDQAR